MKQANRPATGQLTPPPGTFTYRDGVWYFVPAPVPPKK